VTRQRPDREVVREIPRREVRAHPTAIPVGRALFEQLPELLGLTISSVCRGPAPRELPQGEIVRQLDATCGGHRRRAGSHVTRTAVGHEADGTAGGLYGRIS
jgi:hypothetical protein